MSRPLLAARIEGKSLVTALFKGAGTHWTCADSELLKSGEKSKHAGQSAVLLLGESERSLRHFVLPPGTPANLRRMALLQARARLPDPNGQYLLDVVLEKTAKNTAALTAAIPLATAERGAQRLKEAGLDLEGIALEPLCFAALTPEHGTTLLELFGWNVACRDNGAVGWRNEPGVQLFEEYLCAEPREFKPDAVVSGAELSKNWGVEPQQLPLLAAAISGQAGISRARKQPRFQEFLDRESLAPASLRRKLALTATWAAGVLLLLGGFFLILRREEIRYEALKEKAALRAQSAKLSQRMMKELGQTTQLISALRAETVEKPLAVSPLRSLSDMLPAGVKLTALSYTAEGQMLLDGEALEPRLPVLLLDLLRNAPGFSPPILEFVSDRGAGKFIFRISCKPHAEELPEPPPSTPTKSAPKGEIEL